MFLLLMSLVVSASPDSCDRFFAGFADVDDGTADWRSRPGSTCQEAIDAGLVDVDAVVRALPAAARVRAVCRLGSPALDDLRQGVVDDGALSVRDRGRCLARVAAHDPQVLVGRSFLTDSSTGRRRVSPVLLAAARLLIDDEDAKDDAARRRGVLAPVLEEALRDRAIDRWTLGDTLCLGGHDAVPPLLTSPCQAVRDDQAAAADAARGAVHLVGGAATAGAALSAATVYLVPALLLQDTLLAIPLGALGGAFFGAVVGVAVGAAVSLQLPPDWLGRSAAAAEGGGKAFLADLFSGAVLIVVVTVVGAATGAVVFAVAFGVAAAFAGAPRLTADIAGAVGIAAATVAVGAPIVWGIADETDPVE